MKQQKTFSPRPADFSPEWLLVDARGAILGRLATKIADLLRGKDLPTFAPHLPPKRGVVVINAAEVETTGRKELQKEYFRHSGYRGSDRYTKLRTLREKKPTEALRRAVARMLPKNRLQDRFLANLRLFAGEDHDLAAQKPRPVSLSS